MLRCTARSVTILIGSLALLALLIIGCSLLSFTAGMPVHNYNLSQYDKNFRRIQHPSNTSLVEAKQLVSRSEVNGACVYFVGQLRRYSGSRQEVQAFYANQVNNTLPTHDLKFLFLEDGNFPVSDAACGYLLPYGVRQLSDWQISSSDLEGNLYLVYSCGSGESYFDYRCK
jgi:hypothetical protein